MHKNCISVFILLLLASFCLACKGDKDVLQEAQSGLGEFHGQAAQFQCHDIDALIPVGGKIEGPNCVDNKTVVNGHSNKCVQNGQCNLVARLGEFNAEAELFCSNWCGSKGCAYNYTRRDQCDSDFCLNSIRCRQNCNTPLRNSCSIQQTAPNYNCMCEDPPPPEPEPPVEG